MVVLHHWPWGQPFSTSLVLFHHVISKILFSVGSVDQHFQPASKPRSNGLSILNNPILIEHDKNSINPTNRKQSLPTEHRSNGFYWDT